MYKRKVKQKKIPPPLNTYKILLGFTEYVFFMSEISIFPNQRPLRKRYSPISRDPTFAMADVCLLDYFQTVTPTHRSEYETTSTKNFNVI